MRDEDLAAHQPWPWLNAAICLCARVVIHSSS
jgi:hypothetical protein